MSKKPYGVNLIDGIKNCEDLCLNTELSDLYEKWEQILNELDIILQIYLYSMSANQMTVDVKSAFLIEMAEPIVEVVKIYTDNFVDLNPGNKGTTLRSCLKALIEKYGQDIFEKEMSCDNYDELFFTPEQMNNYNKKLRYYKELSKTLDLEFLSDNIDFFKEKPRKVAKTDLAMHAKYVQKHLLFGNLPS